MLAAQAVRAHLASVNLIRRYLEKCDLTFARQRLVVQVQLARSQHTGLHSAARQPMPHEGRDTSKLPCFAPLQHVESILHQGTLQQEFLRLRPSPPQACAMIQPILNSTTARSVTLRCSRLVKARALSCFNPHACVTCEFPVGVFLSFCFACVPCPPTTMGCCQA